MRIEFEQKDKEHINIIGITDNGERSEVGHIFTPSGSGETNLNAIQICGFDEAFDLWGCGVYGDAETKQMKKDIQLCWFRPYKHISYEDKRKVLKETKDRILSSEQAKRLGLKKNVIQERIMLDRFGIHPKDSVCHKCFNYPCSCENLDKYGNPYTVKREQDLHLDKKKVEDKKSSPLTLLK